MRALALATFAAALAAAPAARTQITFPTLDFLAPAEVPDEPAGPREVPVFWVLGQSNAAGPGSGFWLSLVHRAATVEERLYEQPGVRIWWPGDSGDRPDSPPGWEPFRTGFFYPVNNSSHFPIEGGFGPEAAFGNTARRALGETVYLFKFTRIVALHPDAPTTWSKRADRETVYDDMMAEWRRARDQLAARQLVPKVHGVIWVHGESDLQAYWASTYGQNLARFVRDLRADIAQLNPDNGPVRFVISEMHARHVPQSYWAPQEVTLRAGQVHVVRTVPDCALVDTDDLPLDTTSPGHVHFDAPALLTLGVRLFTAWRDSDRER